MIQSSRREILSALAWGGGLLSAGLVTATKAAKARTTPELPPIAVIALNRMAFGARPGDGERVQQMGFAAYVEEQLYPQEGEDAIAQDRLANARLRIEYEAGQNYPALQEDRPLRTLDAPLSQLWPLTDYNQNHYAEWMRPVEEVRAATWIRAIYSQWQLREVLVDFWHNHFNVNAYMGDSRVSVAFPAYDRMIRQNCFGNFRTLLEGVAKSPPMLVYLNNASSKASPANENYARELLELHTLGVEHYFNDLYDRWQSVPGATQGRAEGYIDQDVYEAARAFTGWAIADGTQTEGNTFPNTGEFYYYEAWHDSYQKRFLGVEFPPNRPPLADGYQVLDLVAAHPGTAQHLCTKLCRRLVADHPPASLVNQAVQTWMNAQQAPDQILQTVRTILRSAEFTQTWGQKVKRPFELVISFFRATEADFRFTPQCSYILDTMGQSLFAWKTPTGHPDRAEDWINTNIDGRLGRVGGGCVPFGRSNAAGGKDGTTDRGLLGLAVSGAIAHSPRLRPLAVLHQSRHQPRRSTHSRR
ncbi:MAG: DUF1800 domain-containing protein [Oculatellaceae cyanobacterium Prado106]|nr:DUF1800 domain-containing protein [Oculatellaceae cyanobacterium Prado106]